MNIFKQIKEERIVQPALSLVVLIFVASLLVAAAAIMFNRSDTREIVRSIQQASRQELDPETIIAPGIDDDGILSESEVQYLIEQTEIKVNSLDPEADFGPSVISPSTLGL